MCFICNKKGCQLNKHIREKHKELKKKFKERFSQGFDIQTSQYIAKCEEIYYKIDDDIEDLDKTAKTLIINIRFLLPSNLDQENININIFITFFETIYQAKKMTANAMTKATIPYSSKAYQQKYNKHKIIRLD